MINFNDPGLYAIWFCPIDSGSNYMAALFERPNNEHEFMYRIRYYSGTGDPHDGTDEKNWYAAKTHPVPIGELFTKCQLMGRFLTQIAVGPMYELLRNGRSVEEFAQELAAQPWVSAKKLSPEEDQSLRERYL